MRRCSACSGQSRSARRLVPAGHAPVALPAGHPAQRRARQQRQVRAAVQPPVPLWGQRRAAGRAAADQPAHRVGACVGGRAGRWEVACRWRAAGWAGPCACVPPAAAVHTLKASLAICSPVPLLCIQVRVPGGLRGAAALARQRHPFGSRARHAAALRGRVACRAGGGSGSSSKARWRRRQRQRGRCVTQSDVAPRHVASWPADEPEVAYSRSLTTLTR